jgi:hypothetical protein
MSAADCRVCGKPVCADCSLQLSRGTVCEDPEHKIVLEEWDIVFRSNSEFEADMIVRNLEYQQVKTKVFSSRTFKQTIGVDPYDSAQVFTHRDDYQRAILALSALGLLDTEQRTHESHQGGSTVV